MADLPEEIRKDADRRLKHLEKVTPAWVLGKLGQLAEDDEHPKQFDALKTLAQHFGMLTDKIEVKGTMESLRAEIEAGVGLLLQKARLERDGNEQRTESVGGAKEVRGLVP